VAFDDDRQLVAEAAAGSPAAGEESSADLEKLEYIRRSPVGLSKH
jgi:hypothetical protein